MSDNGWAGGPALDIYSNAARRAVAGYVDHQRPVRYLYEPIRDFTRRPGKSLRPALCLAACEAFGGSMEDGLPSAAAVELLHDAFLIHDDIEDGTEKRRGQATLHMERGVPIAINAGDALAVLSQRPLLENVARLGSRMSRAVLAEFQVAMERTVEGQGIELGWRAENVVDLSPSDYLNMILRKTCAYTTILPLRVGALIGSWGSADLDAIARFGFALGAAFQIRDDVLDLVSADGTYGKDVLGDIHEGKRTLAVIHLLRYASRTDRARVIRFLAAQTWRGRHDEARHIRDLMDRYGSVEYASGYATEMAKTAEESFREAFGGRPPSRGLALLRDIVPFMVERAT